MKHLPTLLLTVLMLFSVTLTATAHSGRTDYKGGHTNHSTGEYHYHHGYPEHQHINGECPYEFNDNTNHKSESPFSSSQSSTIYENETDFLGNFFTHYFIFFFVCCAFFGFWLIKFSDLLGSSFLSLNKSILKALIGSIIISITSIVFVHIFETKSLNYIIPVIGLFILSYVLCWPIRKSKYKKYHNKDFFRVYNLVDKKGEYEHQFFEDWRNNKNFSGDYYCYTCYVARTSNTIHYKKGCSNANTPSHLLKTNGNICQKCGKIKREVSLDRKTYDKFIDICDVLNFWNIKPF